MGPLESWGLLGVSGVLLGDSWGVSSSPLVVSWGALGALLGSCPVVAGLGRCLVPNLAELGSVSASHVDVIFA